MSRAPFSGEAGPADSAGAARTERWLGADLAGALRRGLDEGLQAAARSGSERLFCARFELPACDLLACWGAWVGGDRFYWEHPADRVALVARGCLRAFESAGPDRVGRIARAARDLFARLHRVGVSGPERAGPLLLGGFAFASRSEARERGVQREPPAVPDWTGFGPGRLWLPELMLVREGDRVLGSVNQLLEAGTSPDGSWRTLLESIERAREDVERAAPVLRGEAELAAADRLEEGAGAVGGGDAGLASGCDYRVRADRPHAVYRQQVRAALAAIEKGELEKLVLARSLEVTHPGRFDLPRFLARLRELYPTCVSFGVARGDECFAAASPERLIRLEGDRLETAALAGSAPRGRSPERDEALARALRESPKERREHAAVVGAVRAALADVCSWLEGPSEPELLRIEGIQHLKTPLSGRLRPPEAGSAGRPGVLELLDRLHPTPAVGGLPRRAAMVWLERHEELDRGWYAGPVGFVDAAGGGEFWVGLRSAWIHSPRDAARAALAGGSRARLYAGAGIVRGSDPECELRETRLKLRALLAPLTEI